MQSNPKNPPSAERSSQVSSDGTVDTGNVRLPFSAFATDEARQTFRSGLKPVPAEVAGDLEALRAHYARFNDHLRDRMLELFPVEIEHIHLGGIPAHRVTSTACRDNSGPVLVNLHGGAFMWGSGSGALVEAIPVAAATGWPVIAVDYRLAPEHPFPAAADDVRAVYEALLARTPARAMGIYGCSAGAMLTTQCIAQFLVHGLPLPGGIAMLGGAGLPVLGDSAFTCAALSGERQLDRSDEHVPFPELRAYLQGVAPNDPRVAPGVDPAIIKQFPPSLLVAGSRDLAASSVATMHRRLVAQGVDAEFFLFDGLWHAFHVFPDLPESREVYRLLARFFGRTLTPVCAASTP